MAIGTLYLQGFVSSPLFNSTEAIFGFGTRLAGVGLPPNRTKTRLNKEVIKKKGSTVILKKKGIIENQSTF